MLHDGCEICNQLWREYAEATYFHLKIQGKRRIAAIEQDATSLGSLELDEQAARQGRETAQAAVKAHQTEHSPKAMTAR